MSAVLDGLRMALGLRARGADVALVHRSDAGSQYTSHDYRQELSDQHSAPRRSAPSGDCYDDLIAR